MCSGMCPEFLPERAALERVLEIRKLEFAWEPSPEPALYGNVHRDLLRSAPICSEVFTMAEDP